MITFIEPLYKGDNKIQFGWNPEPIAGVASYNIYVGQVSGSLTKIVSGISTRVSDNPINLKKVAYDVTIETVRTALSLPATADFSNLVLYFAITYTDIAGAESLIGQSHVIEVPPVGILGRYKKEDPSSNRNIFGFSDEAQRWVKAAATGSGALIVNSSDFFAPNVTTAYTRDSSGNPLTALTYWSDRTTAGSPAKLFTYTYDGGFVSKLVITDSTV
jgi:hypothetical protein